MVNIWNKNHKNNLKIGIEAEAMIILIENQSVWRKMVNNSWKAFKEKRVDYVIMKWALRKQYMTSIPDNFQPEHACNICGWVFLFKATLANHLRSHDDKQFQADYVDSHLQLFTQNIYQFWDKVCESVVCLKSQMRMNKGSIKYTSHLPAIYEGKLAEMKWTFWVTFVHFAVQSKIEEMTFC